MSTVTPSPTTDEALREALRDAHLPSLLPALGLLTGDWERVRALLPEKLRVVDEQGGMDAAQQAAARDHAFEVLRRERDGDLVPRTDRASVLEGLRLLLGDEFDAYHRMSLEELAIDDADPRAPSWRAAGRNGTDVLDVLVVGAGMSGLLAAHRLSQAGVRFTVLEKNPEVGGTWFENSYPGCRVDVPSHLYSFSCLRDQDWPSTFATRDEVQEGFRRFARDNALLDHVRFGHEVVAARFDDDAQLWHVDVDGDGGRHTLRTRVFVSAVGQLNRPNVPDLPGRDTFDGRQFHSAAWDHDAPLDGKRYAVVGTGASAIQVITGLLDAGAQQVTVFQRSPAWLFPTPDLRRPVDEGLRLLLRTVPTYARWYRLWLHRSVSDGLLPFTECDPNWEDPRSISAINDTVRQALTAYLQDQFGEDPELLAEVMPDYPPFSKRVLRDDGSYARAFLRDGARLVTAGIQEVVPQGIRTADGELHELDGIVYATGFEASRFLVPMQVTGRGGRDLHEQWGPDATAYLGMAVPGFPNMFLLYGPNTNIVVNGSAIFFSECQLRLLLDAVREAVEHDAALEVREDVHDAFVEHVDALNAKRAWGCAGVRNWYLSPTGRVSQNWPGTALDYWERTRSLNRSDFMITTSKKDSHA